MMIQESFEHKTIYPGSEGRRSRRTLVLPVPPCTDASQWGARNGGERNKLSHESYPGTGCSTSRFLISEIDTKIGNSKSRRSSELGLVGVRSGGASCL
eukprot:1070843-Rhodomonas_salina.1